MDYIKLFKKQNITFNYLSENQATEILKTKYSFYKLYSYVEMFDRYRDHQKENKFVKLDFLHLYELAEADTLICSLIMHMCLEIEEAIKTRFIFSLEKQENSNIFLANYCKMDTEFADYVKTKGLQNDANIFDFLEFAQFGTLEKIVDFFCGNYCFEKCTMGLEFVREYFPSVKRIRNIVAHNNSLINRLNIKTNYKDYKMRAFLGNNGVKNRTLKTNMSKQVVDDLCNFLLVYFKFTNSKVTQKLIIDVDKRLNKKIFANNDLLKSTYIFFREVINIFSKQKKL